MAAWSQGSTAAISCSFTSPRRRQRRATSVRDLLAGCCRCCCSAWQGGCTADWMDGLGCCHCCHPAHSTDWKLAGWMMQGLSNPLLPPLPPPSPPPPPLPTSCVQHQRLRHPHPSHPSFLTHPYCQLCSTPMAATSPSCTESSRRTSAPTTAATSTYSPRCPPLD